MTANEKNELNAILRECFRYFVQNNMIQASNELKMMYYIRDKVNLRIADTSSYGGAFQRLPNNFTGTDAPELSDM